MPRSDTGKGQVFSGEFLLSFVLFLTALILLLSLWTSSTRDVLTYERRKTMEELGVSAAEKLIRTPGYPDEWNASSVTSVGLANVSRILSPRKIIEFTKLTDDSSAGSCGAGSSYECNVHMLGIGGYDFSFNLTYLNGSTVVLDGYPASSGRFKVDEKEAVTITRTAILNDDIVRMYFTIWRAYV